MKKFFVFILIASFVGLLFTNSSYSAKRWVLIEEFTNASCGPCAQQNPTFKQFLNSNSDRVIPVIYRTSWPGRDVMYSKKPEMYDKRVQYYNVTGVPYARTNGKLHPKTGNWYDGAPGDVTGMEMELGKYAGAQSPITITPQITLNGYSAQIKVEVTSTEAISNKVLRVAVVEGYHYYDNAGTNGEKNFYYIVRDMLPNVDGTKISVAANDKYEYNTNYNLDYEWYKQLVYVVAWLQDDATKEVLQAGTSPMPSLNGVENFPKISLNLTLDANQVHGFVEQNVPQQRKFKIQNPNNKKIKVMVVPDYDYVPEDWSITLDKTELEIDRGATQEVTATITPGATVAYGSVVIQAIPYDLLDTELPIAKEGVAYALHKNTKYLCLTGLSNQLGYLQTIALNSPNYNKNIAFMPGLDESALNFYSPNNFDVVIIESNIYATYNAKGILGNNYTQSNTIRNYLTNALNAAKNVLIVSEWELANTFANSGYTAGQTFFSNVLGIKATQTIPRVQNNTLMSFNIKGVANDPISNGLNLTCNNHQYAGSFHAYTTDIITLTGSTNAQSFLYMDNNQSYIGGVRLEKSNGAKAVYMSVPFTAIEINNALTLYTKIMDWFLTKPSVGPKIAVSETKLNFGTIFVGKKNVKSVVIENTGDKDLYLNSVMLEGDANKVFNIKSGDDVTKLAPKQVLTIEIEFAPKEKKNYTAKLKIQSNASDNPTIDIPLEGVGDVETTVAEFKNKFTVSIYPNPVSSIANINIENTLQNSITLDMQLIDLEGNILMNVYNGTINQGNFSMSLPVSQYSSGTYYLKINHNGQIRNIPLVIVR